MEKKRQYKRYLTRVYCGVFDRVLRQSLGCLVELSENGMQIMTDMSLDVDKEYRLRVEMNKPIDGSRDIIMDTECKWIKKSTDPTLYYAGFEFEKVDDNMRRRIDLFINSSAFRFAEMQKTNLE